MLKNRMTPLMGFTLALLAAGSLSTPVNGQSETTPPANGKLTIQATQGTQGGTPIGISDVEVSLLSKDRVIKTINTQLNEQGIVFLDDIPIDTDFQPVIRIQYAGVTYQEVGQVMGTSLQEQTIQVKCYEVTSVPPEWTMPIRQIMLSYTPQGIKITEIHVINNPDDQTWLGTPHPQPSNKPVTMSLGLPLGAKQIKLGSGFHDWCCTSFESGTLVNHLPLMPEKTELDFSYVIETEDGTFDLAITAPSYVEQLAVMVPDTMHAHSSDGLALGGTRQIADTLVRYYTATDISEGNTIHLSLSGLPRVRAVSNTAPKSNPVADNSGFLIVIIASGIILIAAASMAFKVNRNSMDSN